MIISLQVGQSIVTTREINRVRVSHWKYARECGDVLGGLVQGAELRIVDISKRPGDLWVRAQLPGQDPPSYLKIAGEEYALCFAVAGKS